MVTVLLMILGFFAGLLGALTGIGGGVLLTPILALYFGIPIREALSLSDSQLEWLIAVAILSGALADALAGPVRIGNPAAGHEHVLKIRLDLPPGSQLELVGHLDQALARPGSPRHKANQRPCRSCAKGKRPHHGQFSAMVPHRTARGSLVDG